jgi:hypothetical protein
VMLARRLDVVGISCADLSAASQVAICTDPIYGVEILGW